MMSSQMKKREIVRRTPGYMELLVTEGRIVTSLVFVLRVVVAMTIHSSLRSKSWITG